MICNLCKGAQNLLAMQNRRREYFTCPFCVGIGDITPIQPATIAISASQQKVIAKAETRRNKEKKDAKKAKEAQAKVGSPVS